ncbi:MAG: MMPL family transporter [Myxococcales bacterium]|nr:MMPL family transporter [Myxococcales bacterium]
MIRFESRASQDSSMLKPLTALGRLQTRHPWLFVLGALAVIGVSIPWAVELRLNGDFTSLLPEHKAAVQDLETIQEQFGGKATLTLMLQGPDVEDVRAVARRVAPELEELAELGVVSVDWNVLDFIDFATENRFLYAELEDLEEISDALHARLRYEMAKANPLLVDLQDGPPPDPEKVAERLEEKTEEAKHQFARYPDGFFQHPELNLVALFIRSSIRGGETASTNKLLSAIEAKVDAARDAVGAPQVEAFFGGDMMDILEETRALTEAVIYATIITIVLVFASIVFFFRSWRSVPLLGLTLLAPLIATFGIAYASVEYLNASTAFLSSIVVGNGINPSVIWLARYFESRAEDQPVGESILNTHLATWAATLTASMAAGIAYGSLIITDFRGFRDFGIIGGTGMVLCWLAAFLVLPALVALSESFRPLNVKRDIKGSIYGALFARWAGDHPKTVLVGSVAVTVVSVGLVAAAIAANPMEYDFRNLQSERDPNSRVQWVNDRQGEIVDETTTGSSIAILLEDRAETSTVVRQLEQFLQTHPTAFGTIRTLDDLVPDAQDEKLEVLDEIRDILPKLEEFANAGQRELLNEHRPPESLDPIEAEDLPASVSRFFRDKQGELGRIIYLEHHEARNSWDGEYMIEWAGAARSVRLPNGERPAVVGQPPIFVDLLDAIFKDGPKAIGVAFVATALLLVFTFRAWPERLLTLGALLLGIIWMAATMAAFDLKLNFLNFVAFPITFGNGADYGVNIMRRYVQEFDLRRDRLAAVRASVKGTGGAVVLCSLTTIIGYISLYTSSNRALNSFGAAMAISEFTCVASGVLVLPAALMLIYRDRKG